MDKAHESHANVKESQGAQSSSRYSNGVIINSSKTPTLPKGSEDKWSYSTSSVDDESKTKRDKPSYKSAADKDLKLIASSPSSKEIVRKKGCSNFSDDHENESSSKSTAIGSFPMQREETEDVPGNPFSFEIPDSPKNPFASSYEPSDSPLNPFSSRVRRVQHNPFADEAPDSPGNPFASTSDLDVILTPGKRAMIQI
jgi:hypothetical protein